MILASVNVVCLRVKGLQAQGKPLFWTTFAPDTEYSKHPALYSILNFLSSVCSRDAVFGKDEIVLQRFSSANSSERTKFIRALYLLAFSLLLAAVDYAAK